MHSLNMLFALDGILRNCSMAGSNCCCWVAVVKGCGGYAEFTLEYKVAKPTPVICDQRN